MKMSRVLVSLSRTARTNNCSIRNNLNYKVYQFSTSSSSSASTSTSTPPTSTSPETSTSSSVSDTKRAEVTLKRFWKTTTLAPSPDDENSLNILLDHRKLKTTGGKVLSIPKNRRSLAILVAHEWDRQEKALRAHSLPLTSLVGRALDDLCYEDKRQQLADSLINFLNTDTICYHGDQPAALVALQDKHWKPLLEWVNSTYNANITPFTGLLNTKQDPATIEKFRKIILEFDPYQLASFERAVLSSKSFIIALALVEGHISIEEAAKCAHVEVQSQIDRWGEVEDTHDVDYHDIRLRLGSAKLLLYQDNNSSSSL